MPLPQLNFVMLFVEDPIKSSVFYRCLLNTEAIEESATFAMIALGNGIMLGLWSPKTANPPDSVHGGGSEIVFCEQDVDGLYDKWLRLGVFMAMPPTDMEFGRTFVALDPDGHRIRVYAPIKES